MTETNLEFQRDFYDEHYPRKAAAVREQLVHPLFGSFNDRMAADILDWASPDRVKAGSRLRIFEPGCGEGLLGASIERVARARGLTAAYTGADLSRSALDLARTLVAGEFLDGDAADTAAALPPASQDVVVAKNLLHHLDDPAGFLRAVARVLAPGGRLVAFEPRLGSPQFLLFNVLAARRERHFFQGQRRNAAAFETAGYQVLDRHRFNWVPYELAFAIRPPVFRRLLGTANQRVISGVARADDHMTAVIPWLASYEVWVASPFASETSPSGTNSR